MMRFLVPIVLAIICPFFFMDTVDSQGSTGPSAFSALDLLRGRNPFSTNEIRRMVSTSKAGVTFPNLTSIPQTAFSCDNVKQPGFYADTETGCQVYRRCETGMSMSSYLCPPGTLFNQIALVCDFWYNVQCTRSQQFVDYSNPRLYQGANVKLLENEETTPASFPPVLRNSRSNQ